MTAERGNSIQSPQNASITRIGGGARNAIDYGFTTNDVSSFDLHQSFVVAIGNSMDASTADKMTLADPCSPPKVISVSQFSKGEVDL